MGTATSPARITMGFLSPPSNWRFYFLFRQFLACEFEADNLNQSKPQFTVLEWFVLVRGVLEKLLRLAGKPLPPAPSGDQGMPSCRGVWLWVSVGWLRFPHFWGMETRAAALGSCWAPGSGEASLLGKAELLLGAQPRDLTLCFVCYLPPVHLAHLTAFGFEFPFLGVI